MGFCSLGLESDPFSLNEFYSIFETIVCVDY